MRRAVLALSLGAASYTSADATSQLQLANLVSLLDEHTIRISDLQHLGAEGSGGAAAVELNAGWLRERCMSPLSVQAETRQPLRTYHDFGAGANTITRAWLDRAQPAVEQGAREKAEESGPGAARKLLKDSDLALFVEFGDGHQTQYSMELLKGQLHDHQNAVLQPKKYIALPPKLWGGELTLPPIAHWSEMANGTDAKLSFVSSLLTVGICIIKGAGTAPGTVTRVANQVSFVRPTFWGQQFNVRTVPDAAATSTADGGRKEEGLEGKGEEMTEVRVGSAKYDLAYSANSLAFHTDNPYRDHPPEYQLLHVLQQCRCSRNPTAASPPHTVNVAPIQQPTAGSAASNVQEEGQAEEGGPPCSACSVMNAAVDGFHVALQLRREDPRAFAMLCTVSVRFENDGGAGNSALVRHAPIIELSASSLSKLVSGELPTEEGSEADIEFVAINFSAKSGCYAPPMEADVARRFYEARRRFSELLHDAKNIISFQLEPGDVWVFDNQRVLHARSPVRPSDGERWLQGAYMDRSQVQYNFQKWSRTRAQEMDLLATAFSSSSSSSASSQSSSAAKAEADLVSGSFDRLVPGGGLTQLKGMNAHEFEHMSNAYSKRVNGKTVDRILALLQSQRGDRLGYGVDLYEHGLQTASRAFRGGEAEEVVVMSLLHDVTEVIQPKNHGGVVAEMLSPWLSPDTTWMLRYHEVFQLKYYGHLQEGANPELREAFIDHPMYNATVRWCELYDQAAFDAAYPNLPLSFFRPMVERLMAKEKYWWDKGNIYNF